MLSQRGVSQPPSWPCALHPAASPGLPPLRKAQQKGCLQAWRRQTIVVPPGARAQHWHLHIAHCWGSATAILSPRRDTTGGVQKVNGPPTGGGFIWLPRWPLMTPEILPLSPKRDFVLQRERQQIASWGSGMVSCLFWPCCPAAFWLTRALSCLGDGAEPNGSQAPASFGAQGGMEGGPGRGMLRGPLSCSQLEAGVY